MAGQSHRWRMNELLVGYARVSNEQQDLTSQRNGLHAHGVGGNDCLTASPNLTRWPQLQIARASLLAQNGRREDAVAAYREALALEPAPPVRQHIANQMADLRAPPQRAEET
jgi:predicted RNA polymerase sigma factor